MSDSIPRTVNRPVTTSRATMEMYMSQPRDSCINRAPANMLTWNRGLELTTETNEMPWLPLTQSNFYFAGMCVYVFCLFACFLFLFLFFLRGLFLAWNGDLDTSTSQK